MGNDLEEIEKLLLDFCKKYNCAVEINTLTSGRNLNNKIVPVKICTKIQM